MSFMLHYIILHCIRPLRPPRPRAGGIWTPEARGAGRYQINIIVIIFTIIIIVNTIILITLLLFVIMIILIIIVIIFISRRSAAPLEPGRGAGAGPDLAFSYAQSPY